ncbi:PEP-CTERM sorting domain-containing protein [Pseudoduganella sp. FT93W]|uniref:PEP-CTERM sorting domain-containing protein n=1 Tax=Duganella fentianensis TaxID=2692177 RepID=A0A845I0R3_9BURK|nr:PEP-CTERM sorting domain-containing protein [Duganella fentianensis]MYN44686.1 PEP-CTERM sorting domain-containing protein [Duganella fentianensis]
MKKTLLSSALLAALLSAGPVYAADLAADFSASASPQSSSSTWTYGYSSSAGASYSMILFDSASGNGWSMSSYNTLGTPAVWKNTNPYSVAGVAPGQVSLHPGPVSNGDVAIVRFTASSAGSYSVAGRFFAGDSGDMSAAVILNSDALHPLQSFASTNNSPALSVFTQYLGAGQTLDFVVGNNGSFYSGNTPLELTVTAVPEPAGYVMMLAGGLLLGGIARRRRQLSTQDFQRFD